MQCGPQSRAAVACVTGLPRGAHQVERKANPARAPRETNTAPVRPARVSQAGAALKGGGPNRVRTSAEDEEPGIIGTYYNEPYQQGRCQRSSRCTRSGRRSATRCPRMISPGEIRRLIRAGVRATSCFTVVHQACGPVIPCCLLIELRCPREQRVRGQSPGERGRSGMPGETETNADCMEDGHERLDAPALVLWLAKPGDVVLRESLRQRHSSHGAGRLRPERAKTLTRR